MWLMDAGCGHDFITRSDAVKIKEFIRKASTSVTSIRPMEQPKGRRSSTCLWRNLARILSLTC
eukprot:2383116-Lingulodinium_polyedra.AAC.1